MTTSNSMNTKTTYVLVWSRFGWLSFDWACVRMWSHECLVYIWRDDSGIVKTITTAIVTTIPGRTRRSRRRRPLLPDLEVLNTSALSFNAAFCLLHKKDNAQYTLHNACALTQSCSFPVHRSSCGLGKKSRRGSSAMALRTTSKRSCLYARAYESVLDA